jgi:hypothetical protein
VGDGTADSTGEGESRVKAETGELLGVDGGLDLLLDSVKLVAAGGNWRSAHIGDM